MIVPPEARGRFLAALAILTVAAIAASMFLGLKSLDWAAVCQGTSGGVDAEIFWRVRLPRVCLGFLAGSALAASGMAFQAMFRNPLATPYTLGVSSGASLGAALYVKFGLALGLTGLPWLPLAAFLGAAGSISLVYGLTRASRGFSTATLLLAGVAISFFFTSFIVFIQYIGDLTTSFRVARWLMGGLETVGFGPVLQVLPFAFPGILAVLCLGHELDLLAIGEDIASARGVAVRTIKKIIFFVASLMVGGVVAACGPIGFVGLIVPHVGRLVIGPRHRELAPFTVLAGGAFLVLCDALGRSLIAPMEIPVGIITALLGGPFFLALLLRGRSERENI
ncbi:MAG: iron ABC transporter permease [Elusimicrobia bacterium]|nr:iron ABC transporter permease [Elusimicrobiota bacterium]